MNQLTAKLNEINPQLVNHFEHYLNAAANDHVEGFVNGVWDEIDLGRNTFALRCPCDDNARVRLVNPMNYTNLTTDARSAGVALTILALNRLVWALHNGGHGVIAGKVSRIWETVQNRSRMKPNQLDVPSMIQFLD